MALPLKLKSVNGRHPFLPLVMQDQRQSHLIVLGKHTTRYLHLDLGKHKLKNIARFCLHAHTLKIETSLWQEHTSACDHHHVIFYDRCDQGGLQDVKHAMFLCSCNPISGPGIYIIGSLFPTHTLESATVNA
eukprot:1154914-Pelagomonas_calceolata.AAC.1